jgi:hypothetical protein
MNLSAAGASLMFNIGSVVRSPPAVPSNARTCLTLYTGHIRDMADVLLTVQLLYRPNMLTCGPCSLLRSTVADLFE